MNRTTANRRCRASATLLGMERQGDPAVPNLAEVFQCKAPLQQEAENVSTSRVRVHFYLPGGAHCPASRRQKLRGVVHRTSAVYLLASRRLPYADVSSEQRKTECPTPRGRAYIRGSPLCLPSPTSRFMASMGSVVGEKLTRAHGEATRSTCRSIIVTDSGGGARMQEVSSR